MEERHDESLVTVAWLQRRPPVAVFVCMAKSGCISKGTVVGDCFAPSDAPHKPLFDIVDIRLGSVCIERLDELRAVQVLLQGMVVFGHERILLRLLAQRGVSVTPFCGRLKGICNVIMDGHG